MKKNIKDVKTVNQSILTEKKFTEKNSQKEVISDVTASLAATGMPVGAVAVSGSVSGLSAAGITSGIATLGLGSMAAGISVIAGIGVISFVGVKWLFKKI